MQAGPDEDTVPEYIAHACKGKCVFMSPSLFGPTKQLPPLSFLASKASIEYRPLFGPGSPEISAETNLEMGDGAGEEGEPQKPLNEEDTFKDYRGVLGCDNMTLAY